jgi:hypothetical protein
MAYRLTSIGAAAVLLVACSPALAEACSCMLAGPACQAFWQTDAVFDGTVVAIEQTTRPELIHDTTFPVREKVVKLSARRSWKGVDPGPVEVVTGLGDGDCGFDFVVGERYLVFARRRQTDGRLSASICTLTQPFSPTGDATTFVESLTKPSSGGRIFGSVELQSGRLTTAAGSSGAPMELTLRLSGAGRESSTTSKNGRYEFRDLPPAQYRLDLLLPDSYAADSAGRNVEIPDQRACAEESYSISVNGRIAGQLLQPDGKGAEGVYVELFDADVARDERFSLPAITTEGGYFEFMDLSPGRYTVGMSLRWGPSELSPYPRTVYPGPSSPPETIVVAFGNAVQLQPWKVPRLTPAKVSGTLVWRDGAPASRIALVALDVTDVPVGKARAGVAMADENGRFSLDVWEGRSYALMVNVAPRGRTPTDVTRLPVTAGMGPVRVRISVDRQER